MVAFGVGPRQIRPGVMSDEPKLMGKVAVFMPTGKAPLLPAAIADPRDYTPAVYSAADTRGTSRTRYVEASGTSSTRRPWNAPKVERWPMEMIAVPLSRSCSK
jgi:hypothetical protein